MRRQRKEIKKAFRSRHENTRHFALIEMQITAASEGAKSRPRTVDVSFGREWTCTMVHLRDDKWLFVASSIDIAPIGNMIPIKFHVRFCAIRSYRLEPRPVALAIVVQA